MVNIEIISRTTKRTEIACKQVKDWSEAIAELVLIFAGKAPVNVIEEIKLTKMP